MKWLESLDQFQSSQFTFFEVNQCAEMDTRPFSYNHAVGVWTRKNETYIDIILQNARSVHSAHFADISSVFRCFYQRKLDPFLLC